MQIWKTENSCMKLNQNIWPIIYEWFKQRRNDGVPIFDPHHIKSQTFKCKPLVVGKSANPIALKGLKSLPVIYKNNQRSWVTKDLVTDWFYNHFIKETLWHCNSIGLPSNCNILLFFDNCMAYQDPGVLQRGNIAACFLSANTTSLI